MLRPFRLEEPESVKEASETLARYGDSAKVYAGGTELLLAMKEGLVHFECLVNVKKIPGLDQVRRDNGSLRIGALSTHRELERSDTLAEALPVLVEMEHNVANLRVREVGTLGGNLTFAEPHADPGTLLLALDATVVAQKAGGAREIPMAEFFVDAYEAAIEEDEILAEIVVPVPGANAAVRYRKFGYLERPSAGVALHVMADDARESVRDVRVAVGCVGPKSMRVEEAEAMLRGKSLDEAASAVAEAGDIAGRAGDAISDLHGSAEYKEHIVKVLLTRAFNDIRAELAG
ncbi:MAG: xanthine dehydrogenase family protein subunit M [Deltaproteobacteria bacterium]|nr:xanthine dehydrogenase family protein subunit M [Deltaproteobacteria bacterium]